MTGCAEMMPAAAFPFRGGEKPSSCLDGWEKNSDFLSGFNTYKPSWNVDRPRSPVLWRKESIRKNLISNRA